MIVKYLFDLCYFSLLSVLNNNNDNINKQQNGTGHNCVCNYTESNNKMDNIKEEQFLSDEENGNNDIIVEKMLSPCEMKDEKTYNWNDL